MALSRAAPIISHMTNSSGRGQFPAFHQPTLHPRRPVRWQRLAGACAAGLHLLAAGPAAAQAAGADSATVSRFDIYQYVVEGNSTLSEPAIETAVSGHMGEQKSLTDVEAARAALEKAYHDAGFLTVVVSIPDQAVDTGEVLLKVVEATVDRLRVRGANYTLPSAVLAGVPELAEGKVPNFNTMQAQLSAVNRGADTRVTPVLRAGRVPGTVEVQLDIDDQLPLHGSVELNNRQTPNTTAARLSASLRYDNLLQRGHSLGLTLQTAPQRPADAQVVALNYMLPGMTAQEAWAMYFVHSRSAFDTLANAPGLGLLGNSDTFGLRYNLPVGAGSDATQRLSGGLDFKKIEQTITVQHAGSFDAPIRYVPVVANYSANLIDDAATSVVDAGLTVGLRGLFGNSDARFAAKRAGASAQFLAMRLGLQHSRTLAGWTLSARMDSQLATGPLVPTEQMVAGGADSVRGYFEGERSGDLGLRISLEARTPAFAIWGVASPWRLTGLALIDAARLRTLQAQPLQLALHSLAGAGLGLRLTAPGGVSIELDAVRALLRGDLTADGAYRVNARAVWGF